MRIRWLARWLARRLPPDRKPDLIIGGAADPYLKRWHLIPRNRWFNLYCHTYYRSDDDRAHHDHPWWNISFGLRGILQERCGKYAAYSTVRHITQGDLVFRRARDAHRMVLPGNQPRPPMTLFITGPKVRNWGFWCPNGWRPWEKFISPKDKAGESTIGVGCD